MKDRMRRLARRLLGTLAAATFAAAMIEGAEPPVGSTAEVRSDWNARDHITNRPLTSIHGLGG